MEDLAKKEYHEKNLSVSNGYQRLAAGCRDECPIQVQQ